MKAQFIHKPYIIGETSRMALIIGGIVVAILVIPFLLKDADFHSTFSILPHFSTATKQIAVQITNAVVESVKTIIAQLVIN